VYNEAGFESSGKLLRVMVFLKSTHIFQTALSAPSPALVLLNHRRPVLLRGIFATAA
jgi:hypothetical protein